MEIDVSSQSTVTSVGAPAAKINAVQYPMPNGMEFHLGAAAHDQSDRIIYDSATGALFYDADGSTSGGSTEFAILPAGLQLTHADFFVVKVQSPNFEPIPYRFACCSARSLTSIRVLIGTITSPHGFLGHRPSEGVDWRRALRKRNRP
jgi:hypothetical protein